MYILLPHSVLDFSFGHYVLPLLCENPTSKTDFQCAVGPGPGHCEDLDFQHNSFGDHLIQPNGFKQTCLMHSCTTYVNKAVNNNKQAISFLIGSVVIIKFEDSL